MRKLTQEYLVAVENTDKKIGFHAHNNQNLAFANTIETLSYGVSFLDVTVQGMGRGAGNCATELLIGFLKNPKYNVEPILAHIENHMMKLKEEGVKWGFDIPYILTGQQNSHPRSAIAFQKENRTDYRQLRLELLDME